MQNQTNTDVLKPHKCAIDSDENRQVAGTMGLLKFFLRFVSNNAYLLFGIVLGLYLSNNFRDFTCDAPSDVISKTDIIFNPVDLSNSSVPRLLTKNNTTKKTKQTKLVRPRYYSTELGIREKLFIGVLSSEEKINSQAVYINRTIAHLVDKVKFFVTAQQNIKNKYNLSGIVGFTGTRHAYRPFQIIKYIGDSFIDYDYYFFMYDHNYLNARALKRIVTKISVSLNVYLGIKISDGSYCDLSSGILFSNSVLRAMLDNLDWCIRYAVSEDLGENLGRCVHRSLRLNCQDVVQTQSIMSYKLKHFELENHLSRLSRSEAFKNSVTVHPVLHKTDFYLLHAFYSKQQLKKTKTDIKKLSKELNGGSWPSGQRVGSKPASRFDVAPTLYFNMTHMFFPDDYTNIRKHTRADLDDLERVINAITAKVLYEKPDDFQFSRLINGYRTFQLSRGLDYHIDLAFRDLHTGKEVVKRFEVCKPLGQVEFLSKPYTTENGRVTVLLVIQESELDETNRFIGNFVSSVLDHREKVFLMFAFLYQYNTTSKGTDDIYKNLKDVAVNLTRKYHSEDTKVAWVSIRLPSSKAPVLLQDYSVLSFIVTDLALRKIGMQDLILFLDVYSEISIEFLNRVKMNTIENFQIFSAIPFRQYNPKISQMQTFDLNKRVGQFDREEYKYVSFYARDYVLARKRYNLTLPIIKSDNDIPFAFQEAYRKTGNIFEMFVKCSPNLHRMRATDPALKVRYHEETDLDRNNLFLGNKVQLAKVILEFESKDTEL